ncbi:uncharacterized protein LOC115888520 [Sitophilus oryzae]|uniref:Uncharacterized protein LOC115888520 n=1 Tax=Sitophilus oryzae TaxID=7048 RepID=A0A6J2YLT5_SITOR|nr:uncharacterized protein LOC115888520 [Sitophilus oryzae]
MIQNSSSRNYLTKDLGNTLRILQLNIEGVSRPKSDCLTKILTENKVDVVLLQETHCSDQSQLNTRCKIPGFTLAAATYHPKYGTATYIKNDITTVTHIRTQSDNNIYVIRLKVADTEIINVYKPPAQPWINDYIHNIEHPGLVIGDFNSQNTKWGDRATNDDGARVSDWAETENLFLLFDAKDKGTFHSARWAQDYNPDLCFTTLDSKGLPLHSSREVLSGFPRSQHRPVLINIGLQIPIVRSIPKPRWYFQKANLEEFSEELDFNIQWIPPEPASYERFVGLIHSIAKKHVPRGFRKDYIPGWSPRCQELYDDFQSTQDSDVADELILALDSARKRNGAP